MVVKLISFRHISAMKMKMARYIGVMYKLKKYLPLEARLQIYHSFVGGGSTLKKLN